MIRIKNVTKDYGSNKGVFDLSFEVQDQETFGLLGMEGAGKTTLLQILMGFSNLSGGRCTINAKHFWKHSTSIKNFTGYLPQNITLPESMTGLQFFRFLADLRNRKSLEKARISPAFNTLPVASFSVLIIVKHFLIYSSTFESPLKVIEVVSTL